MKIKIDGNTKLDEICINNIQIVKIDIEKVAKQQEATFFACHEQDKNCYQTLDGQRFLYLAIDKVGCITSLKAGTSKYKSPYCKAQLNVRRTGIGNLIGLTIDEYWQQLEFAKKLLWSIYGVMLDFSSATIQNIEINRTFQTKHPFNEYKRVLTFLCKLMPKIHLMSSFENNGDLESVTGWTSKNGKKKESYKKISFYDKKTQIKYLISLDNELMRFEIKLVGKRNVDRNLKTEFLSNLTQDRIEEWYDEQIDKLIVKPFAKWQQTQKNSLKAIVKEEFTKGGTWQINVLDRLHDEELLNGNPLLLDVEELFPIIDEIKEIKHKKQTKERWLQRASQYNKVFVQHDLHKLEEILHMICDVQSLKSPIAFIHKA